MKKTLLSFIAIFLAITSSFAQQKSHFISKVGENKYVPLDNIYEKQNSFIEEKIGFDFEFNNKKQKTIFINSRGWLSFEKKSGLKNLLDIEDVESFISPFILFNTKHNVDNYHVSFKKNKDKIIIQWKNTELAFQVQLHKNGEIQFLYDIDLNNPRILEKINNYSFGIISNNFVIGNFSFDISNKEINKISSEFIRKSKSIIFKSEKNSCHINNNSIFNKSTPKTTDTYTSNANWICPAGVTSVTVHCIGGGGGGGGSNDNSVDKSGGGGGAGGSYATKIVTVVPGNTYPVNVGIGGAGGNNGDGGDGGASWFSTSGTVYAQGGFGGGEPNHGTAYGGTGSIASSIGTTTNKGGDGGNGSTTLGAGGGGAAGTTGDGGNATGKPGGTGNGINSGDGGDGRTAGNNGRPGLIYGGGGSGSFNNNNTNRLGGDGAGGIVWLDYTISTSMSYASSTTTQASTAIVGLGSADQEIICIEIVTTGNTNPLDVTSFTLNANGTTDINDINSINSAKIYYTGTSGTFATGTLFGQNTPTIASYNILGTQTLAEGTNYFWLTYDVKVGATEGNFVDAECTSLKIGDAKTPTVTAPAGNRVIAVSYCDVSYSGSLADRYINNFSTTGGSTNITNNGTGEETDGYEDYTAMNVTQLPGNTVNFSVAGDGTGTYGYAIWVDWNKDGDFDDANEEVYMSSSYATSASGSFTVPTGVIAGSTRMRVMADYYDSTPELCHSDDATAVEDYTFIIDALPDCSGTPTAGSVSSDMTTFCGIAAPTVTATGYETAGQITYQWQSSPDDAVWTDISGATSDVYTADPAITATTYYRYTVTCGVSSITSSTSSVSVTNTSETITSTNSPVSVACNSNATLTATASGGTMNWYDVPTGGTSLGTGGSYTTNVVGDATFYVSTGDGGSTGHVGKLSSDLSDGYYGSVGTGLVFDALSDMTIVSVKAYVETAGSDVSIRLVNSAGTEVTTVDFTSVAAGFQTFTLNIDVPVGTDYRLVSNNTTNLGRDFSDTGFPYTLASVCSITGGWLSSASTTYYFFFDWVVSSGCTSARVPVDVVVTSGVSAPTCATNPSPLTGAVSVDPAVTLTWDASLDDCQQASSYKLYLGTDNPPTNIENGTDIGNVTSYSPAGLTAPETYYWQIVPTNSAGDAPACNVWSFSTDYTYCESSATSTSDMDITHVQFGTIDNSSNTISLTGSQGTASGTAGMYSDWRASSVPVPTFAQGETAAFTVEVDDEGSSYSHQVNVYIDYNHDGDLNDAGEEILVFPYANPTTPNSTTVNITIPATATVGTTLMRVVCVESSSSSPCGTYTWGETEDYTIRIGIPGTNSITTGPGVETATIASTVDTQAEALLNFDFVVTDDGLTPATDALPTLITKFTFHQGTGNDIADWSNAIAGAELIASDGTSQDANVTINPTSIVFSNVDNSGVGNNLGEIADDALKIYTLKIWLNCPMDDVAEGDNFVFEITNQDIEVETSGSSGFKVGENENSGATNNEIETTATKIIFLTQPSDAVVNLSMIPHVKIAAVDDCNIIDTDYSGTVDLTSTGTMTGGSGLSFANGVADFNAVHTALGTNLTITATSGAWNVTSDQFDISTKDCSITTTPAHTNGEIFVCEGETIDFNGSFTGTGTVDSWSWVMGDGTEYDTQNVSNHEFTTAAGYYVELTVNYTNGPFSGTCATPIRVMVSGGPVINNISPDITSCQGGTHVLSATSNSGDPIEVAGYSGTGSVSLSLADETFLPDTETDFTTYTSVLEYTQFDPTSTLTAADLVTVYANIEHSYFGDLEIELHCPNGQSVHLADGYHESGNDGAFMGEPVDQEDEESVKGNGYEYRWTEVSPTYPEMSSLTAPTYTFTDNGVTPVTYTDHSYLPSGTYAPLISFSGLVGCPLNGEWTLEITDHLAIDNGTIFEWGLELDESLMPGRWDYSTEIISYDWTGAGAPASHPTGPDAIVTPPALGNNTYTLHLEDSYGCTTDQDVIINNIICDGQWTGSSDSDWNNTGNWDNNIVPFCEGGTATIPASSSVPNDPIISDNANAFDVDIETGGVLTIAPSGAMTVCGTLSNNAGVNGLVIKSDASGTGSLIHNNAGVNATVETYIEGGQFHYLSSPISNATAAGIGISGGTGTPQFYSWDASQEWFGMGADPYGTPSTIDYAPWTLENGNLDVGKGYAYFYNTQTLNFQGPLNVANLAPLACGHAALTTGSEADQGWNFFGNPYPSSLNWNLVSSDISDGLEKTLYMFNDADGTGAQANYVYYIPSGGVIPSIGSMLASQFVAPGQGFFVRSSANTDVLQINANAREHSSQTFFKGSKSSNVLRFTIENDNNSDEMILRLLDFATSNFDADYDARKLLPSNSNIPIFYSITDDNVTSAINSLPMNAEMLIVPVGVTAQAGILKIKSTEQTLDLGREVILFDKYLNKKINIYEGIEYSFDYAGGVDNNRFELIFSNSSSEVNIIKDKDVNLRPNPSNGIFNIYVGNLGNKTFDISISDNLGRVVLETKDISNKSVIDISKCSSGIYYLKVNFDNNFPIIKKLIVE